VTYIYGATGDSCNRVGRPVSIEDGSGKQVFKYGKQGEVTEVKRTLVIPNQAVAIYTTKTSYDSWNRLMSMTYPDGEQVKYTYNTGGLLTGVASAANIYVSDIKYDKFEQRTYMKYGNGAETNYAYNDSNRTLTGLSVKSTLLGGTPTLMSNLYKYDPVKNIVSVINNGTSVAASTISGSIGGTMEHTYIYDNLYRLVEAHGDYNKTNVNKNAHYDLFMGYDAMHNVISKRQEISQKGVQFAGGLNAGYNFKYTINSDNCQQIRNIADSSYRYASGEQKKVDAKVRQYNYDANGNLMYINIGTQTADGKLLVANSRKMLWDEENRLLSVSDNGFVSNYWYDASGERTVKESGDAEGVTINGLTSAGRTGTTNFTAYISPYLVVNSGGNYTKHIYMDNQRIVSKLSGSDIFSTSPVSTTDMKAKYDMLTAGVKTRYDSLGVAYKGTPQSGGLISKSAPSGVGTYFYHSDHLGSSSLITDPTGAIAQHIEYVPFGEIFIDERNSSWYTPYLFNAKERDEETGLTYYGARYYDSNGNIWWSVDPKALDFPNVSSYVFCHDNPVVMVDPDGRIDFPMTKAYLNGLWNGGVGMTKMTINAVMHPITTTQKVVRAVSHPVNTGYKLANATKNIANTLINGSGEQRAETVGNILGGLVVAEATVCAVSKVSKLVKAPVVITATAETEAITTPYGLAMQAVSEEALNARSYVAGGGKLYRIGTIGRSEAAEAQFWSTENPLANPQAYAKKYGIPLENIENADFVEVGTLKPGANFITRQAPKAPGNPPGWGGGIEVVTPTNSVKLESFNTIRR
jgi:RHS repeat-associated protein